MKTTSLSIEIFAEKIPSSIFSRSGKVFYSGREAFSLPTSLYALGVNPGGAPSNHDEETVESHTSDVLHTLAPNWSAYRDESWEGQKQGTYGMAPRVLHLFKSLGLNPGRVPCSNLYFVRSPREADITPAEAKELSDLCWPFHAHVIEKLKPRSILCFGKTAGNYVRKKLGANTLVGQFVETNNRHWQSQAFSNSTGVKVVVATHPSIADWTAKDTDPTQLIRESLQ